ncbi:rhomboid family intramembrane serine protease [Thiovibrio sp. JS02]
MVPEEQQMTAVVTTTAEEEMVHLASLVLSAAGIPHQVEASEAGWLLLVAEEMRPLAAAELGLFLEENRDWPPARPFAPAEEKVVEQAPPVLPVIGALVVFHFITGAWSTHNRWFVNGVLGREQVLENGEWWRLLTALTLHADSVHLFGNAALGGVLAYFLCRHLGSGVAWFAVLFSAVVANLVNVFLHDNLYSSVGFSTAVFSMVGMLSGMRLRRVGDWQELVLALGSAAALLALLGSSGERTDLGAHFWGIGVGFAVGLFLVAAGLARGRSLRPIWQWLLFLSCLLGVLAAWLRALSL